MTRESETTVTVYVTYSGSAGARFDRTWYVERHLPLVMTSWSQYGLEEVRAFFPAPTCACRFALRRPS